MECDICGNSPSAKLPFNCATCARSALYPLRIEHAGTLLDKEALGRRVEAVVTGIENPAELSGSSSLNNILIDVGESAKAARVQRIQAETAEVAERIDLIVEQANKLKRDLEEHRVLIAAKKAALARRRSDAESATHGLESRSANELESTQRSIRRFDHRWQRTHKETVHSRAICCMEATHLAGLKQRRRKTKDGSVRDDYTIGGVPIWDLRDLNTASPTQLSASLTNITHFVALTARYLGLRLPAEITLPHKDYPLPTIFKPSSSYLGLDVAFPGRTPNHLSTNSPSTSKTFDQRLLPQPRTLFVDKKLPKLSHDDAAAYSIFIEGVTLLAWDIAWMCRTQGMVGNFNSWEELCPLGRNLWQLFAVESSQQPSRRQTSTSVPQRNGSSTPASRSLATFGQFSHSTSHSFLGAAEGAEVMHDWKLQSPARVIDKVKAHLLAEMQGAEWELLDGNEWENGDNGLAEDEPVMVGGNRKRQEADDNRKADDLQSILSPATTTTTAAAVSKAGEGGNGATAPTGQGRERSKGVNGWTKLKSRNSEGGAK